MQKHNKLFISILAIILTLFMMPPFASAENKLFSAAEETTLYTNIDADILSQLHHVDQVEIILGNMALDKSKTQAVRDFAQMIINDHKDTEKKIFNIADRKNLTIREFTPVTNREKRQAAEEAAIQKALKDASVDKFDKIFLTAMRDDHTKNIKWLESVEENLQFTETKDLVHNLLPTLRSHLNSAKNLLGTADEKFMSQN